MSKRKSLCDGRCHVSQTCFTAFQIEVIVVIQDYLVLVRVLRMVWKTGFINSETLETSRIDPYLSHSSTRSRLDLRVMVDPFLPPRIVTRTCEDCQPCVLPNIVRRSVKRGSGQKEDADVHLCAAPESWKIWAVFDLLFATVATSCFHILLLLWNGSFTLPQFCTTQPQQSLQSLGGFSGGGRFSRIRRFLRGRRFF